MSFKEERVTGRRLDERFGLERNTLRGQTPLSEGVRRVPKQAGPKRDKQEKNRIAAMKAEKDRKNRGRPSGRREI